ncbi:MAG: ferredoxin family protein [Planctomycetales bacterium]|nr:ferredoxin family protein [Planctomycetales bacterium]
MAKRISVVVSQGQSQNPAKRNLEEEIVAGLLMEQGIDVTIVPHLYDLKSDSTGILALQGIGSDVVVMSWLYPRAAHWLLDQNDVRGHFAESQLKADDEASADDDGSDGARDGNDKPRVTDERETPNRKIYCISLKASDKPSDFIEETKRIARDMTTQVVSLGDWVGGSPSSEQLNRFNNPTNDTALGNGNGKDKGPDKLLQPVRIEETGGRRWYPVIDFSRCTNCMECIDFCLFGVYGVDAADTILVEQPDNCRKGCPACSRVCPENAIIFPQHKSPAIAGAAIDVAGLKIDLSKLFGAPDGGADAATIAARERDEQLLLAGREAVGMDVGIPKRQAEQPADSKDELDDLLDEFDELDL